MRRLGWNWRANLPALAIILGALTLFWSEIDAEVRGAMLVTALVVILALVRSGRSARRTRAALADNERAIAAIRASGAAERQRRRQERPSSPPPLRFVPAEPTPSPSPSSSPVSS